MATSAAASISLGYMFATDKFNSRITDFNERMAMYDKLNEIDRSVRRYYSHALSEKELQDFICEGYIKGLNDKQVKYYTKEEYDDLVNEGFPEKTVVSKKYNDNCMILKILCFTETTFDDFESHINNAMSLESPNHVIIDLRGCKGWNLEQTSKLLNLFTPEGDLIYSIDSNAQTELLYSSNNVFYKNTSLAILIDERTSGCAELFTSAMMDYGKAKVIGQPTEGNVTENKVIKLSDGSAISLPVKDYVTRSKKVFSGKGISPQKFVSMTAEQHELFLIDKLEPKDDPQIRAAVLILENSGDSMIENVSENAVGRNVTPQKPESNPSSSASSTYSSDASSSDDVSSSAQDDVSSIDTSTRILPEDPSESFTVSAIEASSIPTSSM